MASIDESLFAEYLDTAGIPDPDLMIRTSGELRLSNYLLWQLAYAEFYVTDCLWPDFDQKEIKIGTFGSTTAQAVRDAGLRLDLEAPSVQVPSMTAALDMFIKENNKGK